MDFSSAIDGLAARVNQVQGYLPDSVNDYLKNRATEEFIKVTGGQKGNQTAEQIARGQYGSAPGVASAGGNAASMNAISGGQVLQSVGGISIPLLLISAVGIWFLMKGKRG